MTAFLAASSAHLSDLSGDLAIMSTGIIETRQTLSPVL